MSDLTGIVLDLPEAEYHARPELSSTGVRKLLESPATFDNYIKHGQPAKTVFDVGTAAHTKVLGVGAGIVVYPPEHITPSGNVSTSKATVEWAAQQRANGFTPISPEDATAVDLMAEAILAHPAARRLLEQDGHREASLFARDSETGVAMRARLDLLAAECGDLKTTTSSAAKRSFEYTVWKFGYHIQQEHYRHTYFEVTGERPPFRFIVVEKAPPYLVGVYELDSVFEQIGQERLRDALTRFVECSESGVWPGLPDHVQLASAPVGAVYEHEERDGEIDVA